jgi:hypothetical protein
MAIRSRFPSCQSQLSISDGKAGSIAACPRSWSQTQNQRVTPLVASPVRETPRSA